jgi:hypothetical protein
VYILEVCQPHEEDDADEEKVKYFTASKEKFLVLGSHYYRSIGALGFSKAFLTREILKSWRMCCFQV